MLDRFLLCFGNSSYRDFHAGDTNGQLRALPRRWILRKPIHPLFIHSGEICFLKQDDGGTHDSFEGGTRSFEDGRHVLQALPGLLLDRIPNNLPGDWVVRSRT